MFYMDLSFFYLRTKLRWDSLLFFVFLFCFFSLHPNSTQCEELFTPEITSGELITHIRYLSSDKLEGRLSGTNGEKKAGKYLADQFKKIGVLPGVNQKTYLQEFSFVSGVNLGSKNLLQITHSLSTVEREKEEKKIFQIGNDFSPITFSLKGLFEGPICYAGYGITAPSLKYDDYSKLNAENKFVLVSRYGPEGNQPHKKFSKYHALRFKAKTAREKGAKGIVFIDDSDEFSKSSLSKLRFDQSFSDSGIAALAISRQVAKQIFEQNNLNLDDLEQTAKEIKGTSKNLPGIQLKVQIDLIKKSSSANNIIGVIKGSGSLAEEVVVIGAHYDHLGRGGTSSLATGVGEKVHNGADDNASGTAGLLEIAGAFAGQSNQLRRTLLFVAFSGEEQGLLGSRHYVGQPILPLDKTVAMINMDMIGRMKGKRLIIGGTGSSLEWNEILAQLNKTSGFDLKFQESGFGPSDHSSFYGKNIPVLFFFTGVHRDYHKPSDDYDKINIAATKRIVDFVFQTAKKISRMERPIFVKTKETRPNATRGEFRVTLGIIPDYGEEVEGVRLSGVREGSPAAKAGLQPGDLLVKWCGKKVTNIYELTYILQEHLPGDQVQISVIRNNKEIQLTAKLEQR